MFRGVAFASVVLVPPTGSRLTPHLCPALSILLPTLALPLWFEIARRVECCVASASIIAYPVQRPLSREYTIPIPPSLPRPFTAEMNCFVSEGLIVEFPLYFCFRDRFLVPPCPTPCRHRSPVNTPRSLARAPRPVIKAKVQ